MASATVLEAGENLTLNVTASGGSGPYAYNWEGLPHGCQLNGGPMETCSGLTAGSYNISVVISDRNNATISSSPVPILVVPTLVAAMEVVPQNPIVGSTAAIDTSVSGGRGPYRFSYTQEPSDCSGNTTPNLTCRLQSAGSAVVAVEVTDSLNASVHVSVSFTVVAVESTDQISTAELYVAVGASALVIVLAVLAIVIRRRNSGRPPRT